MTVCPINWYKNTRATMKSISKTIALSFIAFILLFPALVFAEESPLPSPIEEEITENLKSRLRNTINAIEAEQNSPSLIGFVGTVKDIVKSTIVIEDKAGKKNIVTTDNTNIVRSPGNAEIKIDSVRIDDSIIAIGPSKEDNTEVFATRIIVSEKSFSPPEKLTGMGTITSIKRYSLVINTLKDPELEVFFTSKTIYKSPQSTLDLEDLNEGDQIIFTAGLDADDDWSASVIMRTKLAQPSGEDL